MQKGNTFKKFNKKKKSASYFGEQKRNKYIFFYSILPSSVLYIKYYASTKNLATPNKNRKLPITFFARKTFAKNRRQRSQYYCAKKNIRQRSCICDRKCKKPMTFLLHNGG